MRATRGCLAGLVVMSGAGFAAPESTPTYYLRGYYKIDSQRPTWQVSDGSPWAQVRRNTAWVSPRLVKWGYVPFTHDSQNYYCLIEEGARTGSHVLDKTFFCGDPETVQWLVQNKWAPIAPMIGGGPPLESSLRPRSDP